MAQHSLQHSRPSTTVMLLLIAVHRSTASNFSGCLSEPHVNDSKANLQDADCIGQQFFQQSNVQLCVICIPIVQYIEFLSDLGNCGATGATTATALSTDADCSRPLWQRRERPDQWLFCDSTVEREVTPSTQNAADCASWCRQHICNTSVRYCGAVPLRQWYANTARRNSIHCGTWSQWSLWQSNVQLCAYQLFSTLNF